jgi:hypothetical protein
MKRFLLAALAAAALSTSTGCCRGWFIWPGHYPHNPSFSQCCEPPWGAPDPFGNDHQARPGWGHGPYGCEGQYNSRGIGDWFHHDGDGGCGGQGGCGCGAHGSGAHGYPPAAGYPGMNYGMNGGGAGMYPPGYDPRIYGPPQPAPDAMSAAQIAYPYYTNRGPRDFLLGYPPGSRPPSIGP